METDCAKCTETQVSGTKRVIKRLITKEPAYWEELCKKVSKKDSSSYEKKYAKMFEKECHTIKA